MVEATDRTLVACTMFAEIPDYAKKPVAEQIRLTERFNTLLSEALQNVAPGDRIILDTGGGAAISFLGRTEEALLVAMDLRDSIAAETLQPGGALVARIGINSGPVKLVQDTEGMPSIVGDGITVAHSVMGFAAPGQILVSRAYYDAVSRVSPQVAKLFEPDGARTDKYLREHHVYAAGGTPAGLRASLQAGPASAAVNGNRRLRLGVAGAVAAILIIAIGVRALRTKPPPAPEAAPVAAAQPAAGPAATPAQPATGPAAASPGEAKAPKKKSAKPKTEVAGAPIPVTAAAPPAPIKEAAPAAPGSLSFAITPWGEVYVDGGKRGVSPPLSELQLAPGKHTIEIRNTSFPSYTTTIEVTSGAQSKIKYKFN